MKSMLQESSSVIKAIEKAWNQAGRPEEFTIKVFETEKRNFLGMLKHPAVVSILYNPERLVEDETVRKAPQRRQHQQSQPRGGRNSSTPQHGGSHSGSQQGSRRTVIAEGGFETVGAQPEQPKDTKYKSGHTGEIKETSGRIGQGFDWESEMVMDISHWLKELIDTMNMTTPFQIDSMNGLLKIQFEKPLVKEIDHERMLFASFSHLLMQILKRKHKNKFRGLRLAISSTR